MKNADMPEMPTIDWDIKDGQAIQFTAGEGLTKREHFASMAMQGFLSNSWQAQELDDTGVSSREQMDTVAEISVVIADALLAELERTK